MSLLNWIKRKFFGEDAEAAERRRLQRIAALELELRETNARKDLMSNIMTILSVALLATVYLQSWEVSAFSVAEIAGILIALRSVFYQRGRMKAISAELETLKSKVTYASEGRIAGLLLGMCGGAYVGAGVGIAGGPLGAIAGTVPGAILGGLVFMLTGHIVGGKCTKVRGYSDVAAGSYPQVSISSQHALPPAGRVTKRLT